MCINVQKVYSACASELDYSGFESHIIGKLTDFQLEYHASEMCATPADVETQKKVFRAVGTPQPTRALCLGLGTFSRSKGGVETSSVQLYAFKAMLKGLTYRSRKPSYMIQRLQTPIEASLNLLECVRKLIRRPLYKN
jgi:hypothetical protein